MGKLEHRLARLEAAQPASKGKDSRPMSEAEWTAFYRLIDEAGWVDKRGFFGGKEVRQDIHDTISRFTPEERKQYSAYLKDRDSYKKADLIARFQMACELLGKPFKYSVNTLDEITSRYYSERIAFFRSHRDVMDGEGIFAHSLKWKSKMPCFVGSYEDALKEIANTGLDDIKKHDEKVNNRPKFFA